MNIWTDKLYDLFSTNLAKFKCDRKSKTKIKIQLFQAFKEHTVKANIENKQLRKLIAEKEKQLESLEERFVTGALSGELYQKYTAKFKSELQQLTAQMTNAQIEGSNLKTAVEKPLEIAEKLSQLWFRLPMKTSKSFNIWFFPDGAVYSKQKHEVRTERVNTLFVAIAEKAKGSGENKNGDSSLNRHNSSQVPRTGFEPAHPCERCDLNTVRLPISPPGHYIPIISGFRAANIAEFDK